MDPRFSKKEYQDELEEKILKSKTKEEADKAGGAFITIDYANERIWKIARLVAREPKEEDPRYRFGVKVLSKEVFATGKLEIVWYFGDVDSNNDWYNKHGGCRVKDIPKYQFDKMVEGLGKMAGLLDAEVDIQDYSILIDPENQVKLGRKMGSMECKKLNLSKKTKDHLKKLKEEANGPGKDK